MGQVHGATRRFHPSCFPGPLPPAHGPPPMQPSHLSAFLLSLLARLFPFLGSARASAYNGVPVVVLGNRCYLLRLGEQRGRKKKRKGRGRIRRRFRDDALGPLPLRLVKGWVTLYHRSGTMKREQYTCTDTSLQAETPVGVTPSASVSKRERERTHEGVLPCKIRRPCLLENFSDVACTWMKLLFD